MNNRTLIRYPYLPEGRRIKYVPIDNEFMFNAKEKARLDSLDKTMPTGSVVVKDGKIIGISANGSTYHEIYGCKRVELGIPTGEKYELCEGCHPKNHSEARAILDAAMKGFDTNGADLYMWGHWWCCIDCWKAIIEAGIKDVYLLENSEVLFNKNHPNNIVGKQFEYFETSQSKSF